MPQNTALETHLALIKATEWQADNAMTPGARAYCGDVVCNSAAHAARWRAWVLWSLAIDLGGLVIG